MLSPIKDLQHSYNRLARLPEHKRNQYLDILEEDFMGADFVKAHLGSSGEPIFTLKNKWTYTWSLDPNNGLVSMRHNVTMSKPGVTYVFPVRQVSQFYGYLFRWMVQEPLYFHPEWSSRPQEWLATVTWNLFIDKAQSLYKEDGPFQRWDYR